MSVPDRSNDSPLPPHSSVRNTPKRGGFGEFSALYRARWAMSHPDMRREWPGDGEARPLALPGVADPEPIPTMSAPRRGAPNGDEYE
ncbi:MAG: hypothetical protein K0S86_78 [Geminicoccaceae bacterium]|jgi:hypothetical protein|nr:hypothetical protein [Geminicoccaceae bacterium]